MLIIFLFLALKTQAQRVGFSSEIWQTIKTEHFDIIFTAEQHDLGLYYANVAERAFQNLKTVFTEKPERIVLVINDSTDASNGFATRIPYPLIMAYPVQINDHESLTEAGEWARELITHEMTHILQFEPALGFYKFLRPVFGTIVAPNLLLPTWWKEGMAVEMETQFSPKGRLRSTFQDASLRAMVLDKKLFTYSLASANEVLPSWPFGSRPYLFGSLFWSQLVKDQGLSAADFISQRHGERVPYFVETPLQELTNSYYETEYLYALENVKSNADQQAEHLKKLTPTTMDIFKISGQTAQQPIYSKQHKLLAFIESVDGVPEITILNLDQTYLNHLKNRPTGHIDHIIFHPNLKQIYFTKIDRLNSKQNFSDLYRYDINEDKTIQLTTGQRARDPRFSDDGKQLIYISTFNGSTQLKILDISSMKIEVLLDSKFEERFYSPLFWTPDTILYAKRSADGQQALQSFDLQSKKVVSFGLKYKNISFLRKFGSKLYFISSQNGVANIYQSSDLEEAIPMTHALTGLWSFSIDEETSKTWATVMTSEGFRIAEMNLSPIREKLPEIENKIADRYQYTDRTIAPLEHPAENYSPLPYLWPHYWIPYANSTSTSNGIFIQAQTAGQDPLQIHRYSLVANYQTDTKKTGYVGAYTNAAFEVPFQLGSIRTNQTFGTNDQVVVTRLDYASLVPDVFKINKNLAFQLGIQSLHTDFLGSQTVHYGPFFQIGFSNFSKTIHQISPEDGWGTSLRYEKNSGAEGSQDFNRVYSTVMGFTNWHLPQHHVLTSRINALVTFEPVLNRFGTSNSTIFSAEDSLIPQYVSRGYPPSQFFGRSLWTANTEYRFPISNLEKGSGTNALFLKRLSGAIVADGIAVNGFGIAADKSFKTLSLNESLWSAGIEAKLETTVGFVLPVNLIIGASMPFSTDYASSAQVGFSLQIGGF